MSTRVIDTLAAGAAGLLLGAAIGVLAGSALGRHDDRGLMPWWRGAKR